MFTLTALVLSLTPVQPAVDVSLAQAKVQIIKGKRGTVKAANAGEGQQVVVQQNEAGAVRARELDAKEAQLNSRSEELAQREQELQEKQAEQQEQDRQKAEQQKKLRQQIEKIGKANERAFQNAAGALAGD